MMKGPVPIRLLASTSRLVEDLGWVCPDVAAHLEWSANIRSIAVKKAVPQPISWLSKDEMDALLKVPDRQTPRGRIEHALLLFLYNSGARVSEATELQALESGTDLRTVQALLGHAAINSTVIYTHVTRKLITAVESPLESLPPLR